MHLLSFTLPPLALFALTASAGEAAISNYELGTCQNFWFTTVLSAAAHTSSYYDTPGAYESSKVTAVDAGCSGEWCFFPFVEVLGLWLGLWLGLGEDGRVGEWESGR